MKLREILNAVPFISFRVINRPFGRKKITKALWGAAPPIALSRCRQLRSLNLITSLK